MQWEYMGDQELSMPVFFGKRNMTMRSMMWRSPIEGGWLVTQGESSAGFTLCFVPDINHAWDLNTSHLVVGRDLLRPAEAEDPKE